MSSSISSVKKYYPPFYLHASFSEIQSFSFCVTIPLMGNIPIHVKRKNKEFKCIATYLISTKDLILHKYFIIINLKYFTFSYLSFPQFPQINYNPSAF